MTSDRDTLEALQRFIVSELLEEEEEELFLGRDPLAAGAVDSLGYEQLIVFIEQEFGVTLNDQEAIKENFESTPTLAAFVDSKRQSAKA
jgi:acyl carrier protein